MEEILFDYYYGNEAEQFSFYRIPKIMFTDSRFSDLSLEAKLLYGIMLDRMALSIKNKWLDENDRVYIIFTIQEIMQLMSCAEQKVNKMLIELDVPKGIGLIERKRQGLGKPNIIYVKNFITESQIKNCENHKSRNVEIANQDLPESQIKKDDNHNSGNAIITSPDLRKSQTNNTDINKTDYSDTDTSFLHSRHPPRQNALADYMNERKNYRQMIADNIEFDILKQRFPEAQLNEIVEIMTEAVCSTKATLRVGQEEKPQVVVKAQLLKLTSAHIECVFECLSKNTTEIVNLESYMLTVLYKSYYMIDHRYQTWVNHDLYG